LIEAKKYYYSQKDQERAVEAFERYLERFPSHDEALYLCGVSEVQLNKYYEAIERFDKISNAYSLKRNALLFTSIAYNKLGNSHLR
jgi:outer membrane protein assembly factor BamD (BamD/ComL family)